MADLIQMRRDTAADWTSNNPTLAAGEIGWESDTNLMKIGDGSTAWTSLPYITGGTGVTVVEEIDRKTSGFSFTSLSLSAYDKVWFEGYIDSDDVDAVDGVRLEINGDSTNTNYDLQRNDANNNTGDTTDANDNTGLVATAATAVGDQASVYVEIIDPGRIGTKYLNCRSQMHEALGNIRHVSRIVVHRTDTAAITQVDFTPFNGSNLNGEVILYGRRTL